MKTCCYFSHLKYKELFLAPTSSSSYHPISLLKELFITALSKFPPPILSWIYLRHAFTSTSPQNLPLPSSPNFPTLLNSIVNFGPDLTCPLSSIWHNRSLLKHFPLGTTPSEFPSCSFLLTLLSSKFTTQVCPTVQYLGLFSICSHSFAELIPVFISQSELSCIPDSSVLLNISTTGTHQA